MDTSLLLSLYPSRRSLAFLLATFLGTLATGLFGQTLILTVTGSASATSSTLILSLCLALYLAPIVLMSGIAGILADRSEKTTQFRWLKLAKLPVMLVAGTALVTQSTALILISALLSGVHTAFYTPVKHVLLANLVHKGGLIAANAFVQIGVFLAVLASVVAGTTMMLLPYGDVLTASLLCLLAFAGWVVSLAVPHASHARDDTAPDASPARSTSAILAHVLHDPTTSRAVLALSWLAFVAVVFLSVGPDFVRAMLGGSAPLIGVLMLLSALGLAAGALLSIRWHRDGIDLRFVPLALFVMAAAIVGLSNVAPATSLLPLSVTRAGLSIITLLAIISSAAGFAVVPLRAWLQTTLPTEWRGRVVAAGNVMGATFVGIAGFLVLFVHSAGQDTPFLLFLTGALSAVTAFYTLERTLYRAFSTALRLVFSLLFKAKIKGLEHVASLKGTGVVYVANHTSVIDGLLLAAFLPDRPVIVTNPAMRRFVGIKLYHLFSGHPPYDLANPADIKALVNRIKTGRSVALFPEGRPTLTGILMKVYEAPGLIASAAKAPIVPVRIDGAQYSPFSMLRGKARLSLLPAITLTMLKPVTLDVDAQASSRDRRHAIGEKLYDVMADMMFAACETSGSLYDAFLEAKALYRASTPIVEDIDRSPRSYAQLTVISRIVGHQLANVTERREYVGVMLPNGVGIVGIILSLMAFGRVPALLNFTGGLTNLRAACATAKIGKIITSRKFVDIMELQPVIDALSSEITFIFAEDIKKALGWKDKLRGFVEAQFAKRLHKKLGVVPDDPAVVLFTSGSESAPKGVVLSHKNLLANRHQIGTRIEFNAHDTLFNALPVFHSFGLSVGLFLPLLAGVKAFLYPSPLHYRIIPELLYETNSTILISTDTFLSNYARNAHPYDFSSLRLVVAGGEKLKPETRLLWFEKFGIRILEGYGVTETAPVLAINTAMHNKIGTVGHLLPGIEHQLRAIEGIAKGGSLLVKGPNVMLGYLKASRPGVIEAPYNGWYDTGDVVEIDEDGFVKIIGRAKRFAKIGGEMVSLTAIEAYIQPVFPEKAIGVVSVPDPKKGEQLVLLTDETTLTRELCIDLARARHIPELMIPRLVIVLSPMPLLGTGKIDYVQLNQIALQRLSRGFTNDEA